MPLNTDFWNAAQEDYPSRYGMKRFTKTYRGLILDGDLPLNQEWDKTISPWAMSPRMGENAHYQNDLINRCWLLPDINTMKGIANSQPWKEDYIVKTSIAAHPQHEFPFIVMCGDGGQGVVLPNPDWKSRISPDQEVTDTTFTNTVKTNFYMLTEFDYSRLVWLIRVYIADEGHNNPNFDINHFTWGSWWDLANITDEMYADILSGNKSITGIKFIPYYAGGENYPNSRSIMASTGFLSLAGTQPLDGSATGLGINAPYTTDYIDYSLTAFANYGTSDQENNSYTFSLGSTGNDIYHNNFRCKIDGSTWFDSTIEWAEGRPSWGVDGNFTEDRYYNGLGTDSPYWKTEGYNSAGNWMYMYYRQRLDESLLNTKEKIRDYILTQAAYLGCWFTDKSGVASSGEMSENNPDAYIGVIEDDGLTHGQYQQGSEIDVPQADWANPWEESPYVPYVPDSDPNEYDKDLATTHTTQIMFGGDSDYIMTYTAFRDFIAWIDRTVQEILKTASWAPEVAEAALLAAFGTTNPYSLLTVVREYPFDLGTVVKTNNAPKIKIGNTEFDPSPSWPNNTRAAGLIDWTSLYSDKGVQIGSIKCDTINYFRQYGNFLDYEPYSCAELWIPWCGTVKIDPQIYCGHNINMRYSLDIDTGQLKCQIMRDALQVDEVKGNCGADVVIYSKDYGQIISAQIQAQATEQANKTKFAAVIGQVGMTIAGLGMTAATMGLGAPVSAAATTALATASTAAQRSMAAARISDITNAAQKANTTTAMGMGMQALGTAINTATSIASANNYHISPGGVTFREIGTSNGRLSCTSYEKTPRLNTYRPKFLNGYTKKDFGLYGHQVGFACLKYDQLKNYSGLTCCGSVDLSGVKVEREGQISIVPTQEEIDIIRKSLQTGVYLP